MTPKGGQESTHEKTCMRDLGLVDADEEADDEKDLAPTAMVTDKKKNKNDREIDL